MTNDETLVTQELEVSPPAVVSGVTLQNLEQSGFTQNIIDCNKNLDRSESEQECGKSASVANKNTVSDLTDVDASINGDLTVVDASKKPLSDQLWLMTQTDLESWLNRIASAQSADDCMDCIDALNQLPPNVNELILSNAEKLLPRLWEILNQEQHGSGLGKGNQGLPSLPNQNCLRITQSPGVDKPMNNATSSVKNLITGLWVRTRDGFYGHLGAMVADSRWWVKSPGSRTRDAESRLYDASDIIPMPSS